MRIIYYSIIQQTSDSKTWVGITSGFSTLQRIIELCKWMSCLPGKKFSRCEDEVPGSDCSVIIDGLQADWLKGEPPPRRVSWGFDFIYQTGGVREGEKVSEMAVRVQRGRAARGRQDVATAEVIIRPERRSECEERSAKRSNVQTVAPSSDIFVFGSGPRPLRWRL